MQLIIKLGNPTKCYGCHCLHDSTIQHVDHDGHIICGFFKISVGTYFDCKRPEICIKKNELTKPNYYGESV